MPTGEHLRFHIGRFENGPAILPFCISFSIFSLAAKGFCITDWQSMAANVNQIRPNIHQTIFSFRPPVGANPENVRF
jgi:hypothetical protein